MMRAGVQANRPPMAFHSRCSENSLQADLMAPKFASWDAGCHVGRSSSSARELQLPLHDRSAHPVFLPQGGRRPCVGHSRSFAAQKNGFILFSCKSTSLRMQPATQTSPPLLAKTQGRKDASWLTLRLCENDLWFPRPVAARLRSFAAQNALSNPPTPHRLE
jgi:hypothetical protein